MYMLSYLTQRSKADGDCICCSLLDILSLYFSKSGGSNETLWCHWLYSQWACYFTVLPLFYIQRAIFYFILCSNLGIVGAWIHGPCPSPMGDESLVSLFHVLSWSLTRKRPGYCTQDESEIEWAKWQDDDSLREIRYWGWLKKLTGSGFLTTGRPITSKLFRELHNLCHQNFKNKLEKHPLGIILVYLILIHGRKRVPYIAVILGCPVDQRLWWRKSHSW